MALKIAILVLLIAVAAILALRWTEAPVLEEQRTASPTAVSSRKQEGDSPISIDQTDGTLRKGVDSESGSRASAPEPFETLRRIADLADQHRKNISQVNRVLRQAGCPEVNPDARASEDHLALLNDIVTTTNKEINTAARAVMRFQEPYATQMRKQIKEAVDSGREVPYEKLPGGVLPNRGPYDLIVTTAYAGVVYLGSMPKSPELFEIVDRQLLAERMRLHAFQQWVAELE